MALINPCHRGLAYGDGHIQGGGQLGQVVRVVGDDLFAVNTDPSLSAIALGINGKYIQNGAVTIAPTGDISVPFDAGSLANQTMVLRPTLNGLQIATWQCAGLDNVQHLPSGCR